jgi:hypothetical protein
MAVPPIPTPLDHLGERPFSFYPPILNIEHNSWILRRASWSEILVANTGTHQELWVPRQYLRDVSTVDEPVLIVGLTKELEYNAGQLLPHRRRVLEMPAARRDVEREIGVPEPVDAIPAARSTGSGGTEKRLGRLIAGALVLGVAGCIVLIGLFRTSREGSRIVYRPIFQADLGLSASDDYQSVIRKLGNPVTDRWQSDKGEMKYRMLEYPDKGYSVVLMGTERDKVLYIGALDGAGRVIDSIRLHGGGDTAGLLRTLNKGNR